MTGNLGYGLRFYQEQAQAGQQSTNAGSAKYDPKGKMKA
jgi:hypothetical protein